MLGKVLEMRRYPNFTFELKVQLFVSCNLLKNLMIMSKEVVDTILIPASIRRNSSSSVYNLELEDKLTNGFLWL